MVGLTNPRARKRHNSYDMTSLPTVDSTRSEHGHRSPSPHRTIPLRPRSHHLRSTVGGVGMTSGGVGSNKKSILPLFLPILVFLGVFSIGLRAGGTRDTKTGRDMPPSSILHPPPPLPIVDREEEAMQLQHQMTDHQDRGIKESLTNHRERVVVGGGGLLRGRTTDRKDSSLADKRIGTMDEAQKQQQPKQMPERKTERDNAAVERQGGNMPNNEKEIPNGEDEQDDDPAVHAPPLPDDPKETESRIVKDHPREQGTPQPTTESTMESTAVPPQKVLTLYLEPSSTLEESTEPLPSRQTSAAMLDRIEFPGLKSCADIPHRLPVNGFPDRDPFLPWIHDYFISHDGQSVQFVAGNTRRCETGKGKEMAMAFLQAQVSLFQPVPVARVTTTAAAVNPVANQTQPTQQFRLAAPDDPDLIAAETRFQCLFHTSNPGEEWITFSTYPFNYELVNWRKRGNVSMYVESGSDLDRTELSQLQFSCPIPPELQNVAESEFGESETLTSFWLDVIPIRTPTRKNSVLFTANHTGPEYFSQVKTFNAVKSFGKEHILPPPHDAGRWANLPVCLPSARKQKTKPHTLVACTWTSAIDHGRADDSITFTDVPKRLREWILFHKLVGMDHIYLYDNTFRQNDTSISPIEEIVKAEFTDFVTLIQWPAEVCNTNKPTNNNPGESSSQYASEASCLERFGPLTEWMTFLDVDEYLIPRNDRLDWKSVLSERKSPILGLRSTRGRSRIKMMQEAKDSEACEANKVHFPKKAIDSCLEPRPNETFLRVFNCDAFPPPRPASFLKNKKQIVRPEFVLQHFVHNTTVTKPMATYFQHSGRNSSSFTRELHIPEDFVDELKEGFLLHARTLPAPETMMRSRNCQPGSTAPCLLGYQCPTETSFNATLQRKGLLKDSSGQYCNCWVNDHVENKVLSQLQVLLKS